MDGQRGKARSLATLAVLALVAAPALGQGIRQVAKPAAVVNGEAIAMAEVDAIMNMQPPTATPLTAAEKRMVQRDVVEMLINEKVMKQFFQRELKGRAALRPDSPQVNRKIAELVDGLKKKGGSLEIFLKESGLSDAQLRANVIKQLQWETYVNEHLKLETMQSYYAAYKPLFDKVTVRASHILIRVPSTASDVQRQVATNKLRNLRQDILAGKIDFAQAAKKYSEDTDTGQNGGVIGFFPRRFAVLEPIAQAAFAMKKGEISDLVQTEVGLHLIYVTDRSAGEPSTFEAAKEDVRRACMMEMANAISERERRVAKVVINLP